MANGPGGAAEQHSAIRNHRRDNPGDVRTGEQLTIAGQCCLDRRRSEHIGALPFGEPTLVDLHVLRRQRDRRDNKVSASHRITPRWLLIDGDVQRRARDHAQQTATEPDTTHRDDDVGNVLIAERFIGKQQRAVRQHGVAASHIRRGLTDHGPACGVSKIINELHCIVAVVIADDDQATRWDLRTLDQGFEDVVERGTHAGDQSGIGCPGAPIVASVE